MSGYVFRALLHLWADFDAWVWEHSGDGPRRDEGAVFEVLAVWMIGRSATWTLHRSVD